ncbi:MAG: hypothetical protein C4576_01540 [Desulfobacteraceae bacterium]|nr:MAG: hypothetical protein C4576_01540 [Desulfobacteraceae bacterium]
MCRDVETAASSLEKGCDIQETRSLLRQADACATCPEQDRRAQDAHECNCQLRFRTELQRRLKLDFGISWNEGRQGAEAGVGQSMERK